MHFKCYYLVFALLITGCYVNEDQQLSVDAINFSVDTLITYQLDGSVFTSSDSLGSPFSLAVGQERLFVKDNSSVTSGNLLIFDLSTGDFLSSAVNKGEGPLEMNRLRSLDFKPNQNSGWLYDSSQRKIQFFEGDSLTDKMIRLEDSGFIFGTSIF